uniref:Sphingolipid delta4-desaturase N-terminal domain-containing protein n=1 Tax=Sinocyclocheilus grahami TaxID=75366 RepID=A0A672RCN4_SINGR
MGKAVGRWDFEWVYNEQPHTWRRKEILGKFTLSDRKTHTSAEFAKT